MKSPAIAAWHARRADRPSNAHVSEICTVKAADASAPDVLERPFTYQKIGWIWTDGGISSTDERSGGGGKGL